jgi:hypothetical protein
MREREEQQLYCENWRAGAEFSANNKRKNGKPSVRESCLQIKRKN